MLKGGFFFFPVGGKGDEENGWGRRKGGIEKTENFVILYVRKSYMLKFPPSPWQHEHRN